VVSLTQQSEMADFACNKAACYAIQTDRLLPLRVSWYRSDGVRITHWWPLLPSHCIYPIMWKYDVIHQTGNT